MRTIPVLLFCFVLFSASAQQKKFSIKWVDKRDVSPVESAPRYVPGFDARNFQYNYLTEQLEYITQWETSQYLSSAEIQNIVSRPISVGLLKNIDLGKIPKQVEFEFSTQKGRNKLFAVLRLNPLINDNGTYKKIISFEIAYSQSAGRGAALNTSPPLSNSVLANGDWFRFSVEKNGVYKIDRNFLENLGMNVSAIDPRKLKIYGHGGGMLPLENQLNTEYDLPQTTIQVFGGNDGSFDNGDYLLFYGESTKGRQNMELTEYRTHINLYAERSHYYITADGGNGLRVFPFTQPSGAANTTITSFDDYQFYEVDETSLVKVGRRWFGDRFDIENERSYEFEFPNIVSSEPMYLRVYAAATAEVETSMQIKVNEQNVATLNFSEITESLYARGANFEGEVPATSETVTVDLIYNNGGAPSSTGYLDFISIEAKRSLTAGDNQFEFRYNEAATLPGVGEYVIQNTSNISQIWDVTNPGNITNIANPDNNSSISFKVNLGEIRKYVAISPSDYYIPLIGGSPRVENQNLKGEIFENVQNDFEDIDYLIITSPLLLQQANRLAQHRRDLNNLNVKVVLLETIYEEFNSGKPGIAAIRNFVKYVYDNASSENQRLKYLCLFGDASVDYKNRLPGNNNIVPTYESQNSFSIGAASFASDDFFTMMGPTEGTMTGGGKLDLAVGRIIADSPELAKITVDKIIDYTKKQSYGSWRNNFVLIADDAEDNGLAEYGLQATLDDLAINLSNDTPYLNIYKIYSDAFEQESSAGGERYPDVNEAIAEAVELGATVINYLGHGGEDGLSQERIVKKSDVEEWVNTDRYNVFVTITCEFTKFDNPLRPSGGELLLWQEDAGGVGAVATTRSISVVAGVNFNEEFATYLFDFEGDEDTVAEDVMTAKNEMGGSGSRVIFYFGDPAMKLAIPEPNIELTAINGVPVTQEVDTLEALDYVTLSGKVTTPGGTLMSNYEGILSVVIFDKRIERQTLSNDGADVFEFTTLGETIFRGRASVTGGLFEFDFVVPKDIDITVGNGRISFYAAKDQALEDQTGYNNAILVGGINEDAPEDNLGPEIKLYMNDENFVSGGITNDSPFLLAKLYDKNGINTASGIGHDLVAILDGDETNPYIVNDYYETEVDDYMRGTVYYKLRDLEPGLHTLTFKAWDVYNNSSTAEIQFVVAGDDELRITHVLNYPNPFHNYTEFWFNHNRPFEPLQVQVQVFTVTGKVVWTTNRVITTSGFLSREITWDGRDDFGDLIGKGVYVYKLTVKSTLTNDKVEKFEKLVIL